MLGFTPQAGSALEAETLADAIHAVSADLERAEAFPGIISSPPTDWSEAARQMRALLSAAMLAFRSSRNTPTMSVGGMDQAPPPTSSASKEKPPVDSFEEVESASRAKDVSLAAAAELLQVVSSVRTLRAEHMRDSVFKDTPRPRRRACSTLTSQVSCSILCMSIDSQQPRIASPMVWWWGTSGGAASQWRS